MTILEKILEYKDEEYADFQAKLIPNVPREKFISVRMPILRKLAKEVAKMPEKEEFLLTLPHTYHDENVLHTLLLVDIKDYEECIEKIDCFLPYIDNWAVCDTLSPKVFEKNKAKLINKVREWSKSELTYTCRFGIKTLMTYFLDEDFKKEYLEIPSAIKSDEYYVNMMIAWYFATALAKQWDDTIGYLEKKLLSPWVHNKTIQKARESFRITKDQKEYLKSLKV